MVLEEKNVFIRVVNDVCQSFYVEKLGRYPYGREVRVGFSALPLCAKLKREYILRGMGLYYLRKFEINDFEQMDGWRYKIEPDSIDACVDEIVLYLKKYLIPFFERANSCKTALPEIIGLEKLFFQNHIRILELNHMQCVPDPYAEFNLIDETKYFMALKSENYNFALKSRKALLNHNMESYESMDKIGYLNEEGRYSWKKQIEEQQHEVQKLEEKDWEYFQTLIAENEAYSMEELKDMV